MKPKQIFAVTKYNFRQWHKNPRIVITFCIYVSCIRRVVFYLGL